uniref:HECT-type E3 ubiquitin transferase n=1 Tax=Phallusia mammillata TaxID=59560 RepID=A0A6F9DFJ6_9ASCI|nr:E3 ubiquitin-protein ligase HUWE1-like [Phallusia mammillata]
MKVDRNKLKKCTTEVPADCRVLIDKLRSCSDDNLMKILEQTTSWTVGKCELYHWVDVLDRFDAILATSANTNGSEFLLVVNTDEKQMELTLAVLHFTSLLIEYSFSRHLYSSVEHLIMLLSSSNLDVILSVLNLLYVFSKRSNFLTRLTDKQRLPLLKRLSYLAESWGGKENGFGLAESCLNSPLSSFPSNATTLHYEFYADPKDVNESHTSRKQANNMYCIHVENVHQMSSSPAEIMESLIRMYPIPDSSKMLLYTHLRLAHSFANHGTRLKCVQARLHAISVLVYTNSVADNVSSILYAGFTEELVDLLQVKDNTLVDIKAAALRTLTSIVHLDCRDRTPRLGAIVDVTGVSQYHGFLPVLVRRCIDSMSATKKTKEDNPEFPHPFATALFSFLYHLSSYESGGEALVQSGMMGPLLSVVTNMGDQQEQTTFVTRAVRVIDLITNIDWQAFQAVNGLQVFIDRLEHEVAICRKDAPPACDTVPGSPNPPATEGAEMESEMEVDGIKDETSVAMETEEADKQKIEYKPGAQCLPQRAALFKSVLNFLKKAISDQAFGEQVRHMMDGTLPNSLKHIIGNVEYYGPALFLLAMEVVTVYVFQEPSLLSSLQDNRLTHVMLHALLVKDPPATREVLASLPNIFSALCLNTRGLDAFVNCNPFDRLFHVMLSPEYLLAMRRRRSSDPLGDTASNLGNAMDELMRHQPTLRSATMQAIQRLLGELHAMGSDPTTVCSRSSSSKSDGAGGGSGSGGEAGENGSQADESTAQDDAGSEDEVEEVEETASKPASSSMSVLSASGNKKHVPLLDYMQNVSKFIQAIVSNNTTDDHCREFQLHGGISSLLKLLLLPSLPLDFPASAACQAVTNLTHTVFLLLREPLAVHESLEHVQNILEQLDPLFLVTNHGEAGGEPTASALLHELTQQGGEATDQEASNPLIRGLVHIHAFVTLFLNLPRANQSEIRTIIVSEWGSPLGLKVLQGLNKLYRSLIWESTVLLALCTPGAIPDGSGFGEQDLSTLVTTDAMLSKPEEPTETGQAMETDSEAAKNQAKSKDLGKVSPALAARIKHIKPILTVASKLGRSLAELFGLLVKLAVGKPIRQRYSRHIPIIHTNVAPTRPARALARSLSTLLTDGLSWRAPPDVPSSKLRVTFLICTVGFTIPMLFDERKMPYHLMLQYFVGTGAHNALFDCFKWALSSQLDEGKDTSDSPANELPGSVDDFLDAWLMLIERLVNPRNILNSPHVIHERQSPVAPPDEAPPIVAPFSAVKFLIKTQKAALEALQHLWSSGRLSRLSSRICDSVILILCHLIRGEQIARDKLKEEREEEEKKAKTATSTSAPASSAPQDSDLGDFYLDGLPNLPGGEGTFTAARTSEVQGSSSQPSAITVRSTRQQQPDPTVVQQLMEMGFGRASVLEALRFSNGLEGATEWLLTHSSEEDQLIRAITMSLEGAEQADDDQPSEPQPSTEAAAAAAEASEEATGSVNPEPTSAEPQEQVEASHEPQVSDEEKKKQDEEEQRKKNDELELKMLSQDDEEPMSSSDIDAFAESIFDGSMHLVNQLPDTVYRVCDVIVVLMKRAGKDWADGVFVKLVLQIKEKCEKLGAKYTNGDPDVWVNDEETTGGLATQALLFALLFEEMKEACALIVGETALIATFVNLLEVCSKWMMKNKEQLGGVAAPKWVSPIELLIDLYERTCVLLWRRKEIRDKYQGHKREWKWFDDRSGRWCSYSASNHKSIDVAYKAGLPSVRFTAGRRKYTINFHQLIQFNEESGNRRPIMATYAKDTSKAESETTTQPVLADDSMETDGETGKAGAETTSATQATESPAVNYSNLWRLGAEEADRLVHAATSFVCLPVDADTLHSSMRLLLRLTRSGQDGGHSRALMFARLGGPAALLKLRHSHGYVGFASLATLLLRHVLEDDDTIRISMDRTIRGIAASGAGNASCGVSSGSMGSRELHYVLRALAPAACHHPDLFVEACCDNLRIVLPPTTCRNIDTEEAALTSPSGVQLLKPSVRLQSPQPCPPSDLPPVVTETMRLLLDALVAKKRYNITATDEPIAPITSEGSEQEKPSPQTENPPAPTSTESTAATPAKPSTSDVLTQSETTTKSTQSDELLVTNSAILRLLAELVRSYPYCSYLVTGHHYTADQDTLVQQDCSALSFILDHLLIPRPKDNTTSVSTGDTATKPKSQTPDTQSKDGSKDSWDQDCPALARVLLACLAASHPSQQSVGTASDPHAILVGEIKSALSRALHISESPQKHVRLRALLDIITTIIECTSKPTPQSRRPLGQSQSADQSNDQSSSHIPRLMIRRGLATDLAKIPHFIDLGSPDMSSTVNSTLRPLEVLTRWSTSAPYPAKGQSASGKKSTSDVQVATETTSEERSISQQQSDANEEVWMSATDARPMDDEDNMSDEYMDVIAADDVSQASDLQYLDASEDQPSMSQEDVFMAPVLGIVGEGEGRNESSEDAEQRADVEDREDHEDDTADDVSQDDDEDIADDTINGDDSSDDSDQDDDDQEDDDDLEDDGSEMDNQEMDDDDVDADSSYDDLNYDTFVYDLMQGDQPDNDLFIHLEDIFGGVPGGARLQQQLLSVNDVSARRIALPVVVHGDENRDNNEAGRTIPPPPGTVATCHPLLVRHANHAQVTDSAAAVTAPRPQSYAGAVGGNRGATDGWSHRFTRNGFGAANPTRTRNQAEPANQHTIHLHYTGNGHPRNPPMVLQRLLGPAVAQDILQLSNSLYNEGGGRAQVLVNTDEISHASDDIIDGMFLDNMFQLQSGVMASPAMVPDAVPSSLARWVEVSCVLDAQSLYDCMTLIKDKIVDHVTKIRDQELEERKEKRKRDLAEKQREEEQKKKEKAQEKKEEESKREKEQQEVGSSTEQETPSTDTPVTSAPPTTTTSSDHTPSTNTPNIATPSNTPVATRPDSPTVTSSAERAPAINALQQASSSLLAVSGQLEGLSFTLQQTRDSTPSDDVTTTAPSGEANVITSASTTQDDTTAPVAVLPVPVDAAMSREASPVGMDTTSPASNRSDVTMEMSEQVVYETDTEQDVASTTATTGGEENEPTVPAEGSTEETSNAETETAQQVMEGVDPSFLAALPADIRQEVIREQLSRNNQRSTTAASTSGQTSASGVSPEFLAALPPNIQEEVLEQERRERSRNVVSATMDDGMDPSTFIQTLPAELRQSVLSDMDESLVAVLSEELAAEAQSLRGDAEERQRRFLQERLLSHGVGLFRQGGTRVRHRSRGVPSGQMWGGVGSLSGGMRRRPNYPAGGRAAGGQPQAPVSRQILDHDSLSCLLLLLFVEEGHLNINNLHRVFRNLCYHNPTRDWLVATLVSILQRAGEVRPSPQGETSPMDVTPTQGSKLQKQFQKKGPAASQWPAEPSPVPGTARNTSWMSIRLEAALGSRASIFQVDKAVQPTKKSHKEGKDSSSGDSVSKNVFIHPQAAPVVCRHAVDALIVLSKIFPNYFVASQTASASSTQSQEQGKLAETDFWEILMKLDSHKKKLSTKHMHSTEEDTTSTSKSKEELFDLSRTWLGMLMRMLSHPVVKRSQQLTDRMLRLLAQISRNITQLSSSSANKTDEKKVADNSASVANSSETSAGRNAEAGAENQGNSEDKKEDNEESSSATATMSAHAGTSNTSTVGRSTFQSLTSTTSSSRSQGSISTVSEAPVTSKEEKRVDMEKELSVAVGVLTSHACSEEGLEDATSLLLQLSKATPGIRQMIVQLSFEGAQKLGTLLAAQIQVLLEEIIQYNKEHAEGQSGSGTPSRGVISNRFDSTLSVVLSAKDKFKKIGRELQLPSMQALTSKTSHQAFFLRILKVILQLQQAYKRGVLPLTQSRLPFRSWRRGTGVLSAVRNTVSQLEHDASAIMDIISPLSRRSNQQNRQNNAAAPSRGESQEPEQEPEKAETPRLSERLQLDELWDVLGACLKELSRSHDQHAVLVLQPAVEAFFLVHASETSQLRAQRQSQATEQETKESLLAHIHEQQPVSPGQPAGTSSESAASLSSQTSTIDTSLPLDTQKFLKFADTHRTVLNQILRQSTVPLSEGPFSVLADHTKVLDFDVKRRYFRQELERTEESASRRDDVAIRVRRDHLFEDSFRELHRRTPVELRSRLYVVFDGEDGQDAGGVLREWYLVISREIFNPMYALFRTSPGDHGTYAINPLSFINSNHLSYFKFVGRIVAKAIYDNKLLECYFTRSFYKHILGKSVKYTDMESEDYEFSQGLKYLLEHDISAMGTELFFCVEIEEFGKTETRDLKENGRDLPVTEQNKREYVHLVCQEKMTGAIKKQLGAFLEGFYEIIPKRLISIFDEQELELLISGLPNIDIDDLRQNTEYHKYQATSLQIQWFWRALRSFDQAERAKFLQFVTGTSKVPLLGFAALEGMTGVQKFQIHRDDRSTARLPCAHTCFNQLDLPAYETYDKLRERLLLAISECTEGFGLA